MADTMLPFRKLLKPNNTFWWDDDLQQAFELSKQTITSEILNGVKIFDKTKPTCLPRTGQNTELVSGCFKNTASARPTTYSAASKAGKSHWSGADSHMLPNHATPQSKGRHSP